MGSKKKMAQSEAEKELQKKSIADWNFYKENYMPITRDFAGMVMDRVGDDNTMRGVVNANIAQAWDPETGREIQTEIQGGGLGTAGMADKISSMGRKRGTALGTAFAKDMVGSKKEDLDLLIGASAMGRGQYNAAMGTLGASARGAQQMNEANHQMAMDRDARRFGAIGQTLGAGLGAWGQSRQGLADYQDYNANSYNRQILDITGGGPLARRN